MHVNRIQHHEKNTGTRLVIMQRLSDIITISFCLNFHSIFTYVHHTYNLINYKNIRTYFKSVNLL